MSAPGTSGARDASEPAVREDAVGPGSTPAPAREQPTGRRVQWVLLALGVLAVFYGLLVMSLRPAALASIAVLAGIAFLVGGLSQLALAADIEGGWRWWAYAGGAVGIIAGILAFVYPGLTLFVLAVLTAWMFVVNGVVRIVNSLARRTHELWWLGLIAGLLELLLGLWAVGSPLREMLLLVNLIGIFLVVLGIDTAVTALATRPVAQPGAGRPAMA
jgi:uncharacterized membrane protein HdeD (DUF308 family)